jgi:hypothetical protein
VYIFVLCFLKSIIHYFICPYSSPLNDVKLGFTVREECKLRISENRLLRRMRGPKWKLQEAKGNSAMRGLMMHAGFEGTPTQQCETYPK